ncbi:MAG: hypothetical protein JSW50_00860, partial [Candidatus Latescibacterota bacterium]
MNGKPSMKRRRCHLSTIIAVSLITTTTIATTESSAQCPPLTSHHCVIDNGVPNNYSIDQTYNYWAIMAVMPDADDDKDIAV